MKKTLISVAVALALTSLLGACSNSDDPAPVATAAPSASVPAAPTIVGSQSLAPPAVAVPNLAPALPSSVPSTTKFFNRTATFTVCSQIGSSCETDVETAAEIVAASEDGMTLVYTNSPRGEIGFVDITNPAAPVALGALAMGGEPTSASGGERSSKAARASAGRRPSRTRPCSRPPSSRQTAATRRAP